MAAPSRTFLTAEWRYLVLFNFEVSPSVLLPFVPEGTELDFHEGRTFISLVGFQFSHLQVRGFKIPFHQNFEQLNLRFYVKRKGNNGLRQGVVFIQEIAQKRCLSWAAKWFYGENYLCLPMFSSNQQNEPTEAPWVHYAWQVEGVWNWVQAHGQGPSLLPQTNSEEAFILERSFGYTKNQEGKTKEFMVQHPPWKLWPALTYSIYCNPTKIFGPIFEHPISQRPSSVFIVDGSPVRLFESWPMFG